MAKCLSQIIEKNITISKQQNTKVTVEDTSKNIQVYKANGQNLGNLFFFFSSCLNASTYLNDTLSLKMANLGIFDYLAITSDSCINGPHTMELEL